VLARFAAEHTHLTLADFEGAAGAERVLGSSPAAGAPPHPAPAGRCSPCSARSSGGPPASTGSRRTRWTIDRPKRRRAERHSHDPGKVNSIIRAQPMLRDRVAIALMARLALRKNELRLLRWRDIDLERGATGARQGRPDR
jgi:integrase